MSIKKQLDARSFQEIWQKMTDLERSGLKNRLFNHGISDDTLLNWKKGRTCPNKPYKDILVRVLRSAGYNVMPDTLFPSKH